MEHSARLRLVHTLRAIVDNEKPYLEAGKAFSSD